jgi:hypothetical protein
MKSWRRSVPLLVIVGIGVFLSLQVLFDPLFYISNVVHNFNTQAHLVEARTRWQESKVKSYQVDVKVIIQPQCFFEGRLEVHNSDLEVGELQSGPLCSDPQEFQVDSLLEKIELDLENVASPEYGIRTVYDQKYGFVTELEYLMCPNGILDAGIPDCLHKYTYTNFEVIDEP